MCNLTKLSDALSIILSEKYGRDITITLERTEL